MRGICVKSLFIFGASAVLARTPEDPIEYAYVVDCAVAEYNSGGVQGRLLQPSGRDPAKNKDDCITNCWLTCGSAPVRNLDCLTKTDNMGGCSFKVIQTLSSKATYECTPSSHPNGVSVKVYADDIQRNMEVPMTYGMNISGFESSDEFPILAVAIAQNETSDVCGDDAPAATIPVYCWKDTSNYLCNMTDVFTSYKYYPDLVANGSSQADFFITVIPSDPNMKTDMSADKPYTYATYVSSGVVQAVAGDCSAHKTCNECAAAMCNWCDNPVPTKEGHMGCGVSLNECESDYGYPFNNCDGYKTENGAPQGTGVISLAVLIVLAIFNFIM